MRRDPRPSAPPTLTHEIKCARCNQWVDGRNTTGGKCADKKVCGIRIARQKRRVKSLST